MRFQLLSNLCFALAATLVFSSCGYQLGDSKPTPMRSVRTLAVPTFINRTYENRIEVLAADTVVKQFQQDGTYAIVSENRADAILYGTITAVDRRSVRPVLSNVLATREFELIVRIEFEVVERVTGRVLLKGNAIGQTPFFTSPDLQQDEQQAIPLALQQAAVTIVSKVSEGW